MENGAAGLPEDLWLQTLSHLSARDIAKSCVGVSRKWQEWSYVVTGRTFICSLDKKCLKCGEKVAQLMQTLPQLRSQPPMTAESLLAIQFWISQSIAICKILQDSVQRQLRLVIV